MNPQVENSISLNGKKPRAHAERRRAAMQSDRRHKFTEALRAPRAQQPIRAIEPTLVVTLGGSAGQVGSRLKKYLLDQGTDSFARFRAIDTDETAQAGADGCPSFDDKEFVRVTMDRIRNVIENPEAHAEIVKQIGLDHPEAATFHARLVKEGVDQAGQVRSFGYLAWLSSYSVIQAALREAISDLHGAYSALEKQLASQSQIVVRRHMTIFVVFSAAGGTGSAMALPTMVLLRELVKGLPVEIVAVTITPSTFDRVVEGKPEQQMRIAANADATIKELNAAWLGYFAVKRITIGPDDRHQLSIPAGLFNQWFVVGRRLADGRDLRSKEAVYDATALHLAAVIGTEIADRVVAEDSNHATLSGQTPDPMTRQARSVSVMAAQGLSLPAHRIATHCAAKLMAELMQLRVIGVKPSGAAIDSQVSSWMAEPLKGETIVLDATILPAALLKHVVPNGSSLTRQLYRTFHGAPPRHHRNGSFVRQFDDLLAHFHSTQLPEFESQFATQTNALVSDLTASLANRVNQLAKTNGWRAVRDLCTQLAGRLAADIASLDAEAKAEARSSAQGLSRVKEAAVPLRSIWRYLFKSQKRQAAIIKQTNAAIVAVLSSHAKSHARRVMQAVHCEIQKHGSLAESVLEGAARGLRIAQSVQEDSRAGRSLTTSSQAELDVSSPATDRELYDAHRLDVGSLVDRLRSSLSTSSATALRRIATEQATYDAVMSSLKKHFMERFASVSVVDILADQLSNSETAPGALARIRQALVGCQPMARPESGQNSVEFADSMLVGVPECQSAAKRELVVATIMEVASRRIHADSQYNGSVSHIVSGDRHRIYVIRRCHGACLYYFPETKEGDGARLEWQRRGGHSVSIFNDSITDDLPSILPATNPTDGDVAFALGLAYGWIANCGSQWLWNLEQSDADPRRWVCKLTSHWNGIAFHDLKRRTDTLALNAFVQSGQIVYEEQAPTRTQNKLGQSLEEAFQSVYENEEVITLIQEAFEELRATAGDVVVAQELERYLASLKNFHRNSDRSSTLIGKMIGHLSFQVAKLKGGK